jgi:hypothetical protein
MDSRRVVHHALIVTRLGRSYESAAVREGRRSVGISWSSRGRLAGERVSGRRGVYTSGPRGGHVRRILPAQDLARLPRWSHDGRRLALWFTMASRFPSREKAERRSRHVSKGPVMHATRRRCVPLGVVSSIHSFPPRPPAPRTSTRSPRCAVATRMKAPRTSCQRGRPRRRSGNGAQNTLTGGSMPFP